MNPTTPFRVRVKFAKLESLRFIGHLDLQRLFERALSRTGLPLRYSQGFSPKIRLNIASALPLGFISCSEYLDFWLNTPVPVEDIDEALKGSLPQGIKVLELYEVSNKLPSLQASVLSSQFEILIPAIYAHYRLKDKLTDLFAQESIMVYRRKKTVDIRPMIEKFKLKTQNDSLVLFIQMSSTTQMNGRPDELLVLLGIDPADVLIERTNIIFSPDFQ